LRVEFALETGRLLCFPQENSVITSVITGKLGWSVHCRRIVAYLASLFINDMGLVRPWTWLSVLWSC